EPIRQSRDDDAHRCRTRRGPPAPRPRPPPSGCACAAPDRCSRAARRRCARRSPCADGTVPAGANALAVHDLRKRYGSVQALKGVDLEVAEGELVGLLGPNGAGKSTLVKIAVGLVRASGGTAEVAGTRAGSRPARAALGYLAELFRFPGWYTADEGLGLPQRL